MNPYYDHAGVTIYHGDCREVLLDVGTFDAVVTDPPYGVSFVGKVVRNYGRSGSHKLSGPYASHDDTPDYVRSVVIPIIADLAAAGRRMVLTPGSRMMFDYPRPANVGALFFPSGAGMNAWGFSCSQPIYYYGTDPYKQVGLGNRPDSFSSTEAAEQNGHPCPKSLRVMRWMVTKASLPGHTVLDPFMGSGTTLRAAKDLNRKAIGIEIEERYCEIAAKRLGQEVLDFGAVA